MILPENVIEVKNVCKIYGTHRSLSLKDRIVYHASKKNNKGREVLHDISFNVKKGEALGIVGRNGSGKSTILKLLTKIIRPNKGTVETKGRISCLIELGAGFHPDMSGRENIYINASIFGLDKKEVDKRIQDILDFSEIEDHIDERVRDYSSGMYMRLAFSIAINVNADILIIDEILSVGDIAFQKKCLDKIKELKKSGVTIVLVTQSPEQAMKICDRTLWIDNAHTRMIGDSKTVCDAYSKFMLE
ncbi:Teichoic acid export ATP-binding protein TagH [Candidatus Methanomethylophilus alvi Mx1201]|uniref:Teichoic acid export ATP-binding protein TagH n=1 Tax=Methanomethylophilus alvi (strain Mx1201) TaxID=1236689 RepID=M9S908_METAX|nr:ABC transporter ATP-binding protein [Methanomethylophilus alvi]AGI84856.2 Teichoic acid export ATP-binding protein TagH [Candidatus Methanomethylophilus alvi Mx1201]